MKIKRNVCILLFLVLIILSSKVKAASASISASDTNVTTGTEVTITVRGEAAAWDITISGDGLKNSVTEANVSEDAENTTFSKSVSFTPNKAGKYVINLKGNVTDESEVESSPVSGSVTINVTEEESSNNNSSGGSSSNNNSSGNGSSNNNSSSGGSSSGNTSSNNNTTQTKSSVATLRNLGITPAEYDFTGFRSGTLNYSVSIPNDVETVSIYAYPTDSDATVSGAGSKTLDVGENEYSIRVTAEDGTTTRTYTLTITREEESEEEPEEEPEVTETTSSLTSLEVLGYTLNPEFDPSIYQYTLDITGKIESLEVNTEVANENVTVEVTGNENLIIGENVITIMVDNSETEQSDTYQVIVNISEEPIDLTEMNESFEEAQQRFRMQSLIIYGTIIVIVVLIIVFLISRYRMQQIEKEDDDFEENKDFFKTEEDIKVQDIKNDFKEKNKIADNEEKEDIDNKFEKNLEKTYEINQPQIEDKELDNFEEMDNLEEILRKRKKKNQ